MGRFLGIIPMGGIAKITNSRLFKKMALKAFEQCDKNTDGQLDENELHICLLILYDKLNDKLPCHIRIPTAAEVHSLFERHAVAQGTDPSNTSLNKDQFVALAGDLLASEEHWWDSVLVKATVSIGLQLALFPLFGKGMSYLAKEAGIPFARRLSPALWAYTAEKVYKVIRISAPELP